MNRKHLIVTIMCTCLIVSVAYGLNSLLNTPSSNNSRSDLASSMPSHSLKLQSFATAMAESGLSSVGTGVSFLVSEAGFCVYGNFGQQVNLTLASKAFRGLEYQNANYIIGSVPIPGYTESEDAHVYLHSSGWVVSYYTKEELIAKIIKNFMSPNNNKIRDGIDVVSNALSLAEPALSYYDFRYPTANTLMVVGDSQSGAPPYNNTFNILVPSEIAGNISEFEWCLQSFAGTWTGFGMHNQIISQASSGQTAYGQITLVPSSKPDQLVQPTDLKLDTLTAAWVYNYAGNGGFIILLHYD